MDNVKDDDYYVQKVKKDVLFIVMHMRDVDAEELDENEVLLDSMLFRMIQICCKCWKTSRLISKQHFTKNA